jgi:ATP-binding cassette subfamily C protein
MKEIKHSLKTLLRCFRIIEKRDLRKLKLASLINTLLSILDVLAISALGLLGSLTVSGIQSIQPTGIAGATLTKLGLNEFTFQQQVAIIGGLACILLTSKTFLSLLVVYRISKFLANRSAKYSSKLISNMLSGSLVDLRRFTSQENLFIFSQGITFIVSGVVGASIFLLAEFVLTIVLIAGLFMVEPWLGLLTLMYFGSIGALIFLLLQNRIALLAQKEAELNIQGSEKILEVISLFKELRVKNRQNHYIDVLSASRYEIAKNQADLGIIPNIAKYIIEIGLVIGAVAISAISFLLYDAARAVAILSIFLVTASRIAPAIMRMQTGISSIRQNLASSKLTLEFIGDSNFSEENQFINKSKYAVVHGDFSPIVKVKDLEFAFDDGKLLFSIDSLKIGAGRTIGVSGASGIGKTTFIDILLGLRNPSRGSVEISGLRPTEAIERWPGAISYVPQESFITRGNILDNLTLGFLQDEVPQDVVLKCLEAWI